MRLVGGSSKVTAVTDAETQAFAPFDKSFSKALHPVEKTCLQGFKKKKFIESEDCMRTPKSAGSKAITDEYFSPLFQTPQKQHSVEFAGYIEIHSDHDLFAFLKQYYDLITFRLYTAGLHQEQGSVSWKPRFRLAR